MPIAIQCPNAKCGATADVPENRLGRSVRCKRCGLKFTLAPSPALAGGGGAIAAPLSAVGRYQIRQRLGAGSYGTVYLAYDPQLDREVALKILRPEALAAPSAVERFQREAKAAARMLHRHIVPVYDAGRDGPHHFIASAFIAGRPLDAIIPEEGLEPHRAAGLTVQLVQALAYAHKQGVMHRDVKPQNVMVDDGDALYLTDFGLAGWTTEQQSRLTRQGAVMGTPAYMAPEQAGGDTRQVGPAADQYSAGVVLYELLTGRLPFEGRQEVVLYHILSTPPPAPSVHRPDLDRLLVEICLKAMAKKPEERYADCEALGAALQAWLGGVRPSAPPLAPAVERRHDATAHPSQETKPPSPWNQKTVVSPLVRRPPPLPHVPAARTARADRVRPAGEEGRTPRRWILWAGVGGVAAAALFTVVLVVLLLRPRGAKQSSNAHADSDGRHDVAAAKQPPLDVRADSPGPARPPSASPDTSSKDKDPDKPVQPTPPPVEPTPPTPTLDTRPNPPSKVRAVVGQHEIPPRTYSILVQRQAEQPGWRQLTGANNVYSTDDLVSLPGYSSELSLGKDGGAHLLLQGHVPEFTVHPFENMDFLLESSVTLHQPEGDFDVDLTLNRGRIYLSSHRPNGPVKVRLRFGGDASRSDPGEVWDLTLVEPDTEIGVDLIQYYTGEINYRDGEAPLQEVYLTLLTGRAGVKFNSLEYPNLPAPAVVHWDNKGKGASEPQPIPAQTLLQVRAMWDRGAPVGGTQQEKDSIAHMNEALDVLSKLMTDKQAPVDALLEARQKDDSPMLRLLAVYSFGAVDAVDKLLDVLCTDESLSHDADRNAAIFTLRRRIARSAANGAVLYDAKKNTGLLMKYFKRSGDAETTLQLLHDIPGDDATKPATFDVLTTLLRHEKLAIRELAYWHLMRLSMGARVPLPPYNPADDADKREQSAAAWKALIGKGLPPPQN